MGRRSKQSPALTQKQGIMKNKDAGGSSSQGTEGCLLSQRVWEAKGSAAIFSAAAVPALDHLFSFLYFIYTPYTETHTHRRAYLYFKELLSLCNSTLRFSVVFQMLFMMLASHPNCSCIQLGFNYSLSCKGRLVFQR